MNTKRMDNGESILTTLKKESMALSPAPRPMERVVSEPSQLQRARFSLRAHRSLVDDS